MRGTFGAPATLASYGIEGKTVREVEAQHHRIPRDHLAFVMSLPIALRLVVDGAPFWLVHAGMAPSISLEGVQLNDVVKHCVEHTPHELLWRGAPPSELLPVDCPVVSGHISRREPVDVGHAIAIDTGCGRTPDGRLTAVVLPERRFVTVG
jgi:hypothetical protein